jgi:hypothetical protein
MDIRVHLLLLNTPLGCALLVPKNKKGGNMAGKDHFSNLILTGLSKQFLSLSFKISAVGNFSEKIEAKAATVHG